MHMRIAQAVGVGMVLVVLATGCRQGVPREYRPGPGITVFDNTDWQAVLGSVVSEDGYFIDYGRLESNDEGVRDALYRYVGQVEAVSPENRPDLFSTPDDEMAYYINAFNSVGIYAMLRRGVPGNVRQATIWPGAIFTVDRFGVGDRWLTLDALERDYIHPRGDPRVLFALHRMSMSSPPLRQEPYLGERLDEQLDEMGRRFLSHSRAVQREGDHARINELLSDTYAEMLLEIHRDRTGRDEDDLIEALLEYADEGSPLHGAASWDVLPYDWMTNRPR